MIKKENWLTIPNILSYMRIAIIPLYVYLYINANNTKDYYGAAAVLVFSGITDALDGLIARKTGQITDLGKIVDPLADKLTQVAVVGAMFFKRPYILPLLLLFIVKELYLLINNVILMRKNIMMDGAMWSGKIATATFYLCMFLLVVFPSMSKSKSEVFIAIPMIFQLLSLFGYGYWFLSKFKEEKNKQTERMIK